MSNQLEWDAYRYVLEDPTLDRIAFEARMLDDLDLALAVAEAVSHVDSLRAASFIASPETSSAPSASLTFHGAADSGWHWTSLAVLAASLLLAAGLLDSQLRYAATGRAASPRVASHRLADSWLAIRQTEIVDQSANLVDVSTNFEQLRDVDVLPETVEVAAAAPETTATEVTAEIAAAEASGEGDWLMDAAREFYAQGEAG